MIIESKYNNVTTKGDRVMTMLQMAVQRIEESECGGYDLLDDEDLGYLPHEEADEEGDDAGWYC